MRRRASARQIFSEPMSAIDAVDGSVSGIGRRAANQILCPCGGSAIGWLRTRDRTARNASTPQANPGAQNGLTLGFMRKRAVKFGPETWAMMREAYLAGECAPSISIRLGQAFARSGDASSGRAGPAPPMSRRWTAPVWSGVPGPSQSPQTAGRTAPTISAITRSIFAPASGPCDSPMRTIRRLRLGITAVT